MKNHLILAFLLSGQILFGQQFIQPVTTLETAKLYGFKAGVKTVTEYTKDIQGNETKKIYRFNESGFLTAKEVYDDNKEGAYYENDDNEGRHLSQKTVYQFEKNKMVAIEQSEIIEALSLDDEEPRNENLFMETKRFPYVYDKKGRLKAYSAWDEQINEKVTFHLSHLNDKEIEYYCIQDEKDSVLVYKTIIEEEESEKKVTTINYENGKETTVGEYYFEKDTFFQSFVTVEDSKGNRTRTEWKYNDYSDLIKYTRLIRKKGSAFFAIVEEDGYKYEYAEDGTQLKEYYTKDSKNYLLLTERNIEYKEGQKIQTTRQYNYDGLLEYETIKTYNTDGELISEINKNIFGEYGKLYKQPVISEQYDYRRIYTFY